MPDSSAAEFDRAVKFVRDGPKADKESPNDEKLTCYALFKQATEGDNKTNRPGMLALKDRAKWDAYEAVKGMNNEEAKQKYVEAITAGRPDWRDVATKNGL